MVSRESVGQNVPLMKGALTGASSVENVSAERQRRSNALRSARKLRGNW